MKLLLCSLVFFSLIYNSSFSKDNPFYTQSEYFSKEICGEMFMDTTNVNIEQPELIMPRYTIYIHDEEIGIHYYGRCYLPQITKKLDLTIESLNIEFVSFGRAKIQINFNIKFPSVSHPYNPDEQWKFENNGFPEYKEYLPFLSLYLKEDTSSRLEDLSTYAKVSNIVLKDGYNNVLDYRTSFNKIIYHPDSYVKMFCDPQEMNDRYVFFAGHNVLLSIPFNSGDFLLEFILDDYNSTQLDSNIVHFEIPMLFCSENVKINNFHIKSIFNCEEHIELYHPRLTKEPIDRDRPVYHPSVPRLSINTSDKKIICISNLNNQVYCGDLNKNIESFPAEFSGLNIIGLVSRLNLKKGLNIDIKECDYPLPLSIYDAVIRQTNSLVPPLLELQIINNENILRNLNISVKVDNLSYPYIGNTVIEAHEYKKIKINPILDYIKAKEILNPATYVIWLIIKDNESKEIIFQGTYNINVLPFDTMLFSLINESTGKYQNYFRYLTTWLKRFNSPKLDKLTKDVIDSTDLKLLYGYDEKGFKYLFNSGKVRDKAEFIRNIIKAIYTRLSKFPLRYSNEAFDLGRTANQKGQRIKYPETTLEQERGNCIDLTLLFAYLIEHVGLNARIVIIPGHAFVGWETWNNNDVYEYLETTVVDKASFDVSFQIAKDKVLKTDPNDIRFIDVKKCLKSGIYNP